MEPFEEINRQLAEMALFLEDNAPDWMGQSYSVNLNFRRDKGSLFCSVESYGRKHGHVSREFRLAELRRERSTKKVLVLGALGAAVLVLVLVAVVVR